MHIVLNSFGASIRKENGLFAISTASGKQIITPRDVKTISISKGARISSDAVLLAIEAEIDIMFVDGIGQPKGRVWSIKYGSISDVRRNQLEFLYSSRAIPWVKELVVEKLNNQVAMLLGLQQECPPEAKSQFSNATRKLEEYKKKVRHLEGEAVADIAPSLRGWEGAAAKRYFQAINWCLPQKYQYSKRSQHPAQDWFNSMLNYGYGMLYGKIEGALIKAGIDPYIGIFHRDDYNRPALVFDVIEKYRIWIDYVVIQLCRQSAMSEECFRQDDGAVMLDGLGKRIVIQSVNDYLGEVIKIRGLERSRGEHINLYAQQLASFFLKSNQ
ncbi:MAG: CRISPR-associated endonuclease Cas1 [Saprospiraceae bacterium]|nr:CRISPR-associated endonuclease Cas1 [Saprospiraceae bacterium]